MSERGIEVVEQAQDDGIWNTEPAVATGAIVGIIGAVGSIAVIGGWVEPAEVEVIKENAGVIVPAAFAIAATVQAIWTRMKAYAPRTAARIAVINAAKPTGAQPTLAPPP